MLRIDVPNELKSDPGGGGGGGNNNANVTILQHILFFVKINSCKRLYFIYCVPNANQYKIGISIFCTNMPIQAYVPPPCKRTPTMHVMLTGQDRRRGSCHEWWLLGANQAMVDRTWMMLGWPDGQEKLAAWLGMMSRFCHSRQARSGFDIIIHIYMVSTCIYQIGDRQS